MKKIVLIIFIIVLITQLILAGEINIKTYPNHRISVIIRPSGELSSLDSFHQDTGDGNVKLSLSAPVDEIDLLVTLKKDGVKLLDKKFKEVSTEKPINIKFIPGETPEIVESFEEKKETESNVTLDDNNTEEKVIENKKLESLEENKTEKLEEEKDVKDVKEKVGENVEEVVPITGKTVESLKKIVTSKLTYYIIGVVAIIAVFFLVYFMRNKIPTDFKIRKLSSMRDYEGKLADAEKKLESAKEELDEIKDKKKKLREARERFEKDRKELMKLETD